MTSVFNPSSVPALSLLSDDSAHASTVLSSSSSLSAGVPVHPNTASSLGHARASDPASKQPAPLPPYEPLSKHHQELAVAVLLLSCLSDGSAAVRWEALIGIGRLLAQPHHASAWHTVAKAFMQRRASRCDSATWVTLKIV